MEIELLELQRRLGELLMENWALRAQLESAASASEGVGATPAPSEDPYLATKLRTMEAE